MDQTEQDSIETDAEATLGEIEELRRQRGAGREITDVERMGWDMAERMAARVAALEDELADALAALDAAAVNPSEGRPSPSTAPR